LALRADALKVFAGGQPIYALAIGGVTLKIAGLLGLTALELSNRWTSSSPRSRKPSRSTTCAAW